MITCTIMNHLPVVRNKRLGRYSTLEELAGQARLLCPMANVVFVRDGGSYLGLPVIPEKGRQDYPHLSVTLYGERPLPFTDEQFQALIGIGDVFSKFSVEYENRLGQGSVVMEYNDGWFFLKGFKVRKGSGEKYIIHQKLTADVVRLFMESDGVSGITSLDISARFFFDCYASLKVVDEDRKKFELEYRHAFYFTSRSADEQEHELQGAIRRADEFLVRIGVSLSGFDFRVRSTYP